MTQMTPFRTTRRVRREIDDVLMEWGGYVRTYAVAQGGLQRLVADARGLADLKLTRAPGEHSDPCYANLAAEDALGVRMISTLDNLIRQYPLLWRRMLSTLYVEGLSLHSAAQRVKLSERDSKGMLAGIKRQAEIDWQHVLEMQRRIR